MLQKDGAMAGKVRHLVERGGRYFARIVVPVRLRPTIGRRELTAPLGADRRLALRRLPAIVANFQDRISAAEAQIASNARPRPGRALHPGELQRIHYSEEIDLDERLRNTVHGA